MVGVVALAGGLNAFKQFLSSVPVDSEVAFVLVPQLGPSHESQLVSLLSKVSLLRVFDAKQGFSLKQITST
ncbi:chemotaxis protein CheB [Aureliella helgolandensis]|uniref:chemotaxis protein CheB n=1 Tax=Aureliella helgolandensis TaxID=2527968 RepID=UPI0011A72827